MPNNLVFNNVAENLKTQIYGSTSGGTITSVLVDSNGNIQLGGSVTATVVAGTVTVVGGNITATVAAGTVTVSAVSQGTVTVVGGNITATVAAGTVTVEGGNITATVAAGTVTVVGGNITATVAAGNITATVAAGTVTVEGGNITATVAAGTVTVVGGNITATIAAGTVTIVGGSISATIAGHGFTSSNTTLNTNTAALTNTAFQFDTSQFDNHYSFYIMNTGAATVSVRLQVSPTTTNSYFVNDNTAEVTLTQNQAIVLVPGYFLNYTRVQVLGVGSDTSTVVAYINAQN